jgi:hypothetical protein
MDLRRLRAGEWLAVAGAVALAAALFLPWDPPIVIAVLLALLAVLALVLGVLQATQDTPATPLGAGVLTVVFGFVGVVLVVIHLGGAGAWVALAATVAITAGGWHSISSESVRALPPDLEPELRPAPPRS